MQQMNGARRAKSPETSQPDALLNFVILRYDLKQPHEKQLSLSGRAAGC
jgi:hypothetical protein